MSNEIEDTGTQSLWTPEGICQYCGCDDLCACVTDRYYDREMATDFGVDPAVDDDRFVCIYVEDVCADCDQVIEPARFVFWNPDTRKYDKPEYMILRELEEYKRTTPGHLEYERAQREQAIAAGQLKLPLDTSEQ